MADGESGPGQVRLSALRFCENMCLHPAVVLNCKNVSLFWAERIF